jgi:hypothetical protein
VQPAAVERQGVPFIPSVVHLSPPPPLAVGQVMVSHAPVMQVRSHEQASRQLTSLQALSPAQLIVHFEPPAQLTSSQASLPTQLIVHVQPFGQFTLPHSSSLEQSIVQLFWSSSQLSQSDGH